MKHHVLLTQGLLPSALAVARSLAQRGHRVTLGDHDITVIARFSRHVAGFARLPPPAAEPIHFFEGVLSVANRVGADVILPLFEEGLVLAAMWHRQTRFPAITPPFELAVVLADKWKGVVHAGRAGLLVPATLPATERAEILGKELGYPMVVKPRFSSSGIGVCVVRDQSELLRIFESLEVRDAHVAQAWAGERQLVFQGVFDTGRCVAAHAYRVLCRHPPEHGFGILVESVCDEPTLACGIRFGERVGYHGPLGIDFLIDGDGVARTVEINPRMVLGVSNAVDSGIQIPAIVAELSSRRHSTVTARVPGYASGIQTLHWPARAVTAATGQGFGSQFVQWSRSKLLDPGALIAFLAHVVAHRIRGGFSTESLQSRSLSSSLVRRLLAERACAS